MFTIFLGAGTATEVSPWSTVLWMGVFFAIFYFIAIRPQRKQEKDHQLLVDSATIGDSVLTSSGFYGVIIDVMEDIVVVEFGNNKNCRIPMQKGAIVQIEKVGQGNEEVEDKKK